MMETAPRRRPTGRDSLLRALVAAPQPLAATRPRALTVAPSQPLPGGARFGPTNPGIQTNSPFSGAVAGGGPTNLIHPEQPQDFKAPTYAPLTATQPHPLAVSLLAALTGATGLGGFGGGGGGVGVPIPPKPSLSQYANTNRSGLPPVTASPAPKPPQFGVAPEAGPGYPAAVSAALLAALAQQGQKLNPSSPGGRTYAI
jgi:hypothetical protein